MGFLKSLMIRVGADITGAEKEFKKLTKTIEKTGADLQRTGAFMTKAITVPIMAIGTAAVKAGMDAVESENLFTVSMGKMEKQARAWSMQMNKAYGVNDYAARKYIGTMNVMMTSMGVGEKSAFDMSKGLTQLAYDMASFYNLKPEEAFEKLQAGISGETEPLKRLGIVVNETTVKQKAMELGMIKAGQAMTETQKVAARYAVIMAQTAKAQGDMGRTLDSPANKLRIMQETFNKMLADFGSELVDTGALQNLLDTASRLLKRLADLAKKFGELDTKTQDAIVGWALFAAALGPVIYGLGGVLKALSPVLSALGRIPMMGTTAAAALKTLASSIGKSMLGNLGNIGPAAAAQAGLERFYNDYLQDHPWLVDPNKIRPIMGGGGRSFGTDSAAIAAAEKAASRARQTPERWNDLAELQAEKSTRTGYKPESWVVEKRKEQLRLEQQIAKEQKEHEAEMARQEAAAKAAAKIDTLRNAFHNLASAMRDAGRSFMQFTSYFEIFQRETLNPQRLVNRMMGQLNAMREWQSSLATLGQRGVSGDILTELRGMGPGAVDQINALARMDDAQLGQWLSAYRERQGIASAEGDKYATSQWRADQVIENMTNNITITEASDPEYIATLVVKKLRLAGVR